MCEVREDDFLFPYIRFQRSLAPGEAVSPALHAIAARVLCNEGDDTESADGPARCSILRKTAAIQNSFAGLNVERI